MAARPLDMQAKQLAGERIAEAMRRVGQAVAILGTMDADDHDCERGQNNPAED